MFFFMNLSEAINNKHLQHLDFKQGPPPRIYCARIYFVSHLPAFPAETTSLETKLARD